MTITNFNPLHCLPSVRDSPFVYQNILNFRQVKFSKLQTIVDGLSTLVLYTGVYFSDPAVII